MTRKLVPAETVDFPPDESEPIHTPGAIQAHGVLLVLQEPALIILQVSNNSEAVIGWAPAALLSQSLECLLDRPPLQAIKSGFGKDFDTINPLKLTIQPPDQSQSRTFDGILHRHDGVLLLELEPTQTPEAADFCQFYHQTKRPIARLQAATSLQDMSQGIVEEIQHLTGYDRVMVYRFDPTGAGMVMAEAKLDRLNSFLGLHYPALDVPQNARDLFALNRLRLIPDVKRPPVALVPLHNPLTQRPLDLSWTALRSVSPCYVEYLSNMGVQAVLSIALIQDQKLWGLIACHHYASAKYLPYEMRLVCEFLGQMMSLELTTKADYEDIDYKIKLQLLQPELVKLLAQADNLVTGLIQSADPLLQLVSASGVAICDAGQITLVGLTPTLPEVKTLLGWIAPQMTHPLFATSTLASVYPAAQAFVTVTSGVLALAIAPLQQTYVLWFRPEVTQTVNWGGDPQPVIESEAEGALRLCPRQSFEIWQETVRGQALPWQPCELDAATELRNMIVGVVLRQADKMAQINQALKRTNDELDAFAYIASHDLKEPLRGIHNYSNFLMEDYAAMLDHDGIDKLQTLVRLTQRMEDLINSLLHFSRLGRVEFSRHPTDLNEMVSQVATVIKMSHPDVAIALHLPRPLPPVACDPVQISELLTNLISNAIKYNDHPEKSIEISYLTVSELLHPPPELQIAPTTVVFYIQDNGIGIREKHLETIFRIFKRLHGQSQYGGGTGVGLTIARKIVERHGGKIWVESTYGSGSKFYFTLSG